MRLRLLEADWFTDKTVLDIGCGTGHMTLALALRFNPAHILGVELDEKLVHAARQNIRHFLSHDLVVKQRGREEGLKQETSRPPPLSLRLSRGPLSAPPLFSSSSSSSSRFPNNITFIQVSPASHLTCLTFITAGLHGHRVLFDSSHRVTTCQRERRGQGGASMMSSRVWV